MARTVNLNLRQGETFRWSPTFLTPGVLEGDPALEGAPGVPVDFSGVVDARAQFRQGYGTDVLAEMTLANGGVVVGPEPGQLHFLLTDAQTDALGATSSPRKPRTAAVWDLEVVYGSGDVRRLLQGAVAIDPNITREVAEDVAP